MIGMARKKGLVGLVLIVLAAGCSPPSPPLSPPRGLVFFSLDTTRKDHLPTYGYGRETATNIDLFARRSTVFDRAVTHWTTTLPSHTSMFTGLYPHTHGVGDNTRVLDPSFETLAEILRAQGFRTGAFVSGYPLRLAEESLAQGFEVYNAKFRGMRRDGQRTVQLALQWLAELAPDDRFFLFVHLYDAHGPYRPRDEYLARFRSEDPGPPLPYVPNYQRTRDESGEVLRHVNDYVDRYDAQIKYMDDLVDKVLAALSLDETAVLLTADHGESLAERAKVLDHGKSLWQEQIGVPLVLHAPGLEPSRVSEPVEQVDFLPTLLEILGVPAPEGAKIEGESLLPLMRKARPQQPNSLVFSSVRASPKFFQDRGYLLDHQKSLLSVQSSRWKLIVYPGFDDEYLELYDLQDDPGETVDVAADHPEIRDQLRAVLADWYSNAAEPAAEMELSPEDVKQMKSLGYLGD